MSEVFGQRLKDTGITRVQWIALYYIKNNTEISQRDLSYFMNIKDSSVGRLIDRMERDGWVERKSSESDRRVTYIKLTAEGDKLISDSIPIGVKFNDDLLEGIDEQELIIYEKVLKKMLLNVVK